jgi:hypothetical protein
MTLAITLLLAAGPANAAFVSVQWPGDSQQLAYPAVAEVSGTGYAARADLGSGVFEAASWVVDGNSLAYSSFELLQLRYVAPAADPTKALLLPAGWITVDVTASFAVPVMPDTATQFNNGQLQANVAVNANSTDHVAAVAQSVSEQPGGTGSMTASTSGSQNGGEGVINESSPSLLDATLRLPALTIAPNGVFRLSGLLQTNVLSNFDLVSVDASNTYAIRMQLPAYFDGTLIDTATGLPFSPDWVTPVPLPASGVLLWTAMSGLLVAMRRRRQQATTALST